ncbi:helix-turn-helix domain-containing protein [Agrobacterium tumefaciens]|uniref:helix-turn-helix domain-containing protein n=1 Tax=Agrobacterium tumefaciens TaxID=358 RepID=UPI001F2F7478
MENEARSLAEHIDAHNLVETTDPGFEKTLFRMASFEGIKNFDDIERELGVLIRRSRDDTGLIRADFASLVGLSPTVYARYENAVSSMTVTRLIHLCELLDLDPDDLVFALAPHLYGPSSEEGEDRLELLSLSRTLSPDAAHDLLQLVKRIAPHSGGSA